MNDQQAKDALQEFIRGLTSEEMLEIVRNANQNNFFMYVFIVFAFIMIVGMIVMVWIFIRKDTKKDIRQNEQYKTLLETQSQQYKGLLDGYTKMIDQNATSNVEFRKTIAEIGDVLRELTNTISRSEARNDAEEDKFELIFRRMDGLKAEISKSNASLHQAFREYNQSCNTAYASMDKSIQSLADEIKRNTDWCQMLNKKE